MDLPCNLKTDYISLFYHVNQTKENENRKKQQKTDEQLSPEMVIKIRERDYGGKDLWKR